MFKRRRKPAVAQPAAIKALGLIKSLSGGQPLPASRSPMIVATNPAELLQERIVASLAERKERAARRKIRIARTLRVLTVTTVLASLGAAAAYAHTNGYTRLAWIKARQMQKAVARMIPETPAPEALAKTASSQTPVTPAVVKTTCQADPDQDGCYTSNVIRQGAFLCPDGPRPVALEFASSPVRSMMGLAHRDQIAASTGFATILPTTTRVNYITKDVRVPIDIVAFTRDGRIVTILPNVPARRQMPTGLPAADGIVALRGGEAQRMRLTQDCGFAAYEDGVPLAPAASAAAPAPVPGPSTPVSQLPTKAQVASSSTNSP